MDGDVADSWEDADEEELEKRMELRQMRSGVDQPGSDRMTGERGKGGPESQPPPLRVSEWGGTQYVPPVKILKRPSGDTKCAEKITVEPQHKTMAQREAEYATARSRILGSSPTQRLSKPDSRTTFKESKNKTSSEADSR